MKAIIKVRATNEEWTNCRVLLDTCSTTNFITEELANTIHAPKQSCSIPIGAVNELKTTCTHTTILTISSRHTGYHRTLEFLIIPHISTLIPNEPINTNMLNIPPNIKSNLADPTFLPSPVQMLIGTGPTLSTFSIGQHNISTSPEKDLILQKTQLGWIIGGSDNISSSQRCHLTNLEENIAKFSNLEEVPNTPHLSNEEAKCEEHFIKHVQ